MIDLHNKLSEETRRADKAEFEVKTRSEKMKTLEAEKKVRFEFMICVIWSCVRDRGASGLMMSRRL